MKLIAKFTEDEETYENTVNRIDKTLGPAFHPSFSTSLMASFMTPFVGYGVGGLSS